MVGKNQLEKIVGKKNVLDSPDILDEYAGDVSCHPRMRPGCVVKPGSAEEVQEIVKWANEASTPLVPVSSGAPSLVKIPFRAWVVLSSLILRRMKKIIRIDPNNRVAMVEPGVTFAELQPELEKAGFSAYMPLCPRSSKSVMAACLKGSPLPCRPSLGRPRSLSVRRDHLWYRRQITKR